MPDDYIYECAARVLCRHVCAAWRDCVGVEREHKIWNSEENVASAAAASLPEEE